MWKCFNFILLYSHPVFPTPLVESTVWIMLYTLPSMISSNSGLSGHPSSDSHIIAVPRFGDIPSQKQKTMPESHSLTAMNAAPFLQPRPQTSFLTIFCVLGLPFQSNLWFWNFISICSRIRTLLSSFFPSFFSGLFHLGYSNTFTFSW